MTWYCERKGLEVPHIIGYEIEDEKSGNWSFLLLWYGFAWNRVETWCCHFASADQMAALLKAISESQSIVHPLRGSLRIRNVSQEFAADLQLRPLRQGEVGLPPTRVRLPAVLGSSKSETRAVQWIGPCVLSLGLRS